MDEVTREILWNVGPVSKSAMYLFFLASLGIFGYGFYQRWRVWRRGSLTRLWTTMAVGEPPVAEGAGPTITSSEATSWRQYVPARSEWPGAAARLVRHVVAQQRIARIPWAWLSHLAIFYGFIVLFIGTVIVGLEHYGIFGLFGISWTGRFYLTTSFALDLLGLAFLAGLLVAMARRGGLTRVRPSSKQIDAVILWLFFIIGVSGFLVEALRIGYSFPDFERTTSFVGWGLAQALRNVGLSGEAVRPWHLASWWLHMVAVFAFVAIIPYTKLLHFVLAPAQVAITAERNSGRLRPVSMEEVEATGRVGASEIGDFSWRQLLSFDTCMQCRRCESACPAFATNKPLSPMRVIRDVAEHGLHQGSLHGDVISAETLWSCTTCGACTNQCPVLIDQMGAIVEMRRFLVGEGQVVGSSQAALRSIAARGNPWGLAPEERADWAQGLDVPTTEEKPEIDVLFWVGCAGSYDRRNQSVTRALAKILDRAGVSYAILGKKERCTGDPARRLGDDFTFMEQAQANIDTLSKVRFKRVVTQCAHCFNTLKNEYPDFGGNYQVVHHTQLIDELMAEGRLPLARIPAAESVAFHDPCYLSRHNQGAEPPRAVLHALGGAGGGGPLDVIEPEAHGCNTFCCGAGGGRMWMEERIDQRVNFARYNQLKATGAKTVAVGCPFCMTMLDDAAKNDEAGPLAVKDVAEIVAERLA